MRGFRREGAEGGDSARGSNLERALASGSGAGNVAKVRTFWSPEGTMIASREMGKVWGRASSLGGPARPSPNFPEGSSLWRDGGSWACSRALSPASPFSR